MNDPLTGTTNIFLKVDAHSLSGYFNENDPAPLYKRQLSHKLEQYIAMSVASVKRYTVVFYKFKCTTDHDKQLTEPLIFALRRHFAAKLAIRENEFRRFKKRNWILLLVSLLVVIICQGILMVWLEGDHQIRAGLVNIIDVFSWVLLWHPIDELLFRWNPHLKDISLLKKLTTAEVIITDKESKPNAKVEITAVEKEILKKAEVSLQYQTYQMRTQHPVA